MPTIEGLLDEVFAGQERVSRDEIQRRAVAADLPPEDLTALDALPEGEYSYEEASDAIRQRAPDTMPAEPDEEGIPAGDLDEEALLRELASLHRTRHETFLHGSTQ